MKKLYYGALFGLFVMIVLLFTGSKTNGAPVFTYVYSNSMEPLIKVNDAFVVWPAKKLRIGDIVMFRPMTLQAEFVTHRIIAEEEKGFITKGDNSPYADQDSGEPEVTVDRIIGRVITLHGQPLVLPGWGAIAKGLPAGIGEYAKYLSLLLLILSIIIVLIEGKHRKRKPRHRYRLKHIYKAMVLVSVIIIIASIYIGSRVEQINYLVTQYPSIIGDQVELNKTGQLILKVENRGVIPVWPVLTSASPLSVKEVPNIIWPNFSDEIMIGVSPQRTTGRYQGYVQVYKYPTLLPRAWVVYLHHNHPVYAMGSLGIAFGIYLSILLYFINHIPGLEAWIPIRAIKDKVANRRWKRANARLTGRRRVRR